jgi:hypothetical protein
MRKYWIYHGVRHYVVVLAPTKESAVEKVRKSPVFDRIGDVILDELELVSSFEKKCRPKKEKKCSQCGVTKAVTTCGLCRACNGENW